MQREYDQLRSEINAREQELATRQREFATARRTRTGTLGCTFWKNTPGARIDGSGVIDFRASSGSLFPVGGARPARMGPYPPFRARKAGSPRAGTGFPGRAWGERGVIAPRSMDGFLGAEPGSAPEAFIRVFRQKEGVNLV